MLFANRKLNELASDWLAAFPISRRPSISACITWRITSSSTTPSAIPTSASCTTAITGSTSPSPTSTCCGAAPEAALAAQPLPLHDDPRALFSSTRRRTHNPYTIPSSRGSTGRCAPASCSPSARRPRHSADVNGNGTALGARAAAMWAVIVTIARAAAREMLPAHAPRPRHSAPLTAHRPRHLSGAAVYAVPIAQSRLAGWGPAWSYFGAAVDAAGVHDVPAVHDPAAMGAARQRRPRPLHQYARVPRRAAGALRRVPVRHGLSSAAPPHRVGAALQFAASCTRALLRDPEYARRA